MPSQSVFVMSLKGKLTSESEARQWRAAAVIRRLGSEATPLLLHFRSAFNRLFSLIIRFRQTTT